MRGSRGQDQAKPCAQAGLWDCPVNPRKTPGNPLAVPCLSFPSAGQGGGSAALCKCSGENFWAGEHHGERDSPSLHLAPAPAGTRSPHTARHRAKLMGSTGGGWHRHPQEAGAGTLPPRPHGAVLSPRSQAAAAERSPAPRARGAPRPNPEPWVHTEGGGTPARPRGTAASPGEEEKEEHENNSGDSKPAGPRVAAGPVPPCGAMCAQRGTAVPAGSPDHALRTAPLVGFFCVFFFLKHCQINLFLFQILKSHCYTFRPRAKPAGGGRALCAGRQPHGTRPRTVPGPGEHPQAPETLNIPRRR